MPVDVFDLPRVWGISAGEYSDYHVIAIYTEREAAERAASLVGEEARVEPFPLNRLPVDVEEYVVTVGLDGEELSRTTMSHNERWLNIEDDRAWAWESRRAVRGGSVRGYDQALKAARDKLAQMKAVREGLA